MSIIVIGSVFVDIKGYPSRTYIPGGRNAGKVRYVHGGVSRNIAEDLGNLGLEPVYLSLVDPNGVGEDVLLRLQEHGVDVSLVRQTPEGMGTWLAVFDNNNDVCASISHRPDMMPLLKLLQDKGNTIFPAAESVLLELDLDEPVVEELYRLKAKHGTKVYAAVSNINIALDRRAYLQQTDCFVCNRQEAGVLFSVEFSGENPEALARQLSELVTGAEIPETEPDPRVSVEDHLADTEQAMAVHRILHDMKEPQKEVFSLRVFGELSFRQIGDLFGKTESWARVTYHRAKLSIIEALQEESK